MAPSPIAPDEARIRYMKPDTLKSPFTKSARRWFRTHLGSVLIAATVALGFYAYWIVELIVVRQATDTARVQAELVTHFRNFYATQLGPIATQSGMRLSHDYKTADSTLPLPATLIIELGHYLSDREGGTQVKLYSQQPFPWRLAERKLDQFQIDAIEHFKVDPNSPFVREDLIDGVKVLRYAQADRMLAQCVACHNNHTQSPRTDWKVGDVRGALEVVLPVSQWFFSGAAVLNQAMIIFLALLIGGQVLIWLSFRRLQRMFASTKELSQSTARANEALKLSESKLSSIFNAVPESVVVIDTDGTIVQCNPATTSTFGYTKDDLIGTNISRLMNSWDASHHDRYLKSYLETGVRNLFNQPRLVKARHHDGREITIRLTISETRSAETHLLIGVMQDYTSIEATQAAMADAKDRAEKANRMRGEFLANMSHEIRTPMNGIVGMIDLTLRDDLSAQAKEYLALARDSAQHLLHVIDDILDFSKIEAGALNLVLEPINPRQLIYQTASSLSALANTKGLYWRLNTDPAMPSCILLDPVRFRQVLTNLLGNALKFTRVGGVEISATLICANADAEARPPTLEVTVKDTGIGFDPKQKESLFSPFVQADGSITRAFGGSGLGLAISRRLVLLMGGNIDCESQLGQGATFKVSLPVQVCNPDPEPETDLNAATPDSSGGTATQPTSPSEPAAASGPRKKRLLLVDDHPINLRLLEFLVGKLGYDYLSVTDGERALQRLRQERFDLVLMDVMMPIMDGLTAVQRLREHEKNEGLGHRTCVLFVTAHAMQGDAEKFMAAGADGYLTKPIAPAVLERELKQRLADMAQVVD